jgi:hypothetical protein
MRSLPASDRSQAHLRAHYLMAYQRARDGNLRSLAHGIFEIYRLNWPDELLDWTKILGG